MRQRNAVLLEHHYKVTFDETRRQQLEAISISQRLLSMIRSPHLAQCSLKRCLLFKDDFHNMTVRQRFIFDKATDFVHTNGTCNGPLSLLKPKIPRFSAIPGWTQSDKIRWSLHLRGYYNFLDKHFPWVQGTHSCARTHAPCGAAHSGSRPVVKPPSPFPSSRWLIS